MNKMHGHAHHHERIAEELQPRDLEERDLMTVYQTMAQDFTGLVGGYVTNNDQTTEEPTATQKNMGVGPAVGVHPTATQEQTADVQTTNEPKATHAPEQVTTTQQPETTTHKQTTEAAKPEPTTTETSDEQTSQITTSRDSQTTLNTSSFVTSASPTPESSSVDNILATPSAPTTGSASASSTALGSTASEGMSGGAKAGIAIGAILGVGAIAVLVFFLFMRRKKKSQEEYRQENEKAFGGEGLPEGYASSMPPPPPPKAQAPGVPPALNLRPVTEFAPDLNGNGTNPATAGVAGAASRDPTNNTPPGTPPKPIADRSDPFSDPVNPFGSALTPVTDKTPSIGGSSTGPSERTVAAAAVGNAAASQHSNDTDSYQSAQSRGPSPTGSHPSTTTPANVGGPVIAAGGLPPPNNIHRVQLDFSPSMDDELGLRSGSLVRLVHEYDDGWALCIRLNGTQQGVAPRSCLSARPVMPRPRPAAGARGPPVKGSDGHPMRPGGAMPQGRFYPSDLRAVSPGAPSHPYPDATKPAVQFPSAPRSMSPVPGAPLAQRSMSPGPYGLPGMQRPVMPINQRQRSNSVGNLPSPVSGPLAAPAPAPTGELPPLPGSVPTSMTPSGGPISRKPMSRDA